MRRLIAAAALGISVAASPALGYTIDHYTLIMSWTPGLCWQQPERKECAELSLHRYDGRNLALLALRPEPPEGNMRDDYCFVPMNASGLDRSRRWCDLDEVTIKNDELKATLAEIMPVAQSCQERGVWARYGSCTLFSMDAYFSRAAKLATGMASTLINARIVGSAGRSVKQTELASYFEMQFGEGTAKSLRLICKMHGGKAHLLEVHVTVTPRALTRGLERQNLWKPNGAAPGKCPEEILIDATKDLAPDATGEAATEQAPVEPAIPGEPILPTTSPEVPGPNVPGAEVPGPAVEDPEVEGPLVPGPVVPKTLIPAPGP